MKPLTTTSYAILGLLAIKPWTTYELAKQMEISLRNFWPRAERKLYEEPRKLVAHQLATVQRETVGKRPRSVYRITAAGRQALRAWLDEPGALASLEFETLIKVFFGEHGSKEQLLANLDRIYSQATARAVIDAQWAQHYLTTGGQFPQRLAVISLVGTLQAQLNHTILAWSGWARQLADGWPEDLRTAPPARDRLELIARWTPDPGTSETTPLIPERPGA